MVRSYKSAQNARSVDESAVMPTPAPISLIPAIEFSIEELTHIYNQSRVDYIVPMPMNAARLSEYIHNYDVALEHSVAAFVDQKVLGLSMLGVRPGRTWITRLGVLPVRRRRGAGAAFMGHHIESSRALQAKRVNLEVIKNNVPAHKLFKRFGFDEVRELLILRRPPGPPKIDVEPYKAEFLDQDGALELLSQRESESSWLDDMPSLKKVGNLIGLRVSADCGGGWLVCQSTTFQLGRLVFQTESGDPACVARLLLHALHSQHGAQDTKTENLPLSDPHLPGLLDMGYIESFRRIEMSLDL